MSGRSEGGISLIDLVIILVILGIIVSIAIPNRLAARRAANEASAQSSLRTINRAELTYQASVGSGQYGTLVMLGTYGLVDRDLASAKTSGYDFTLGTSQVIAGSPAQYWAYALPHTTSGLGRTGTLRFAIAEDGVLRADRTISAPANRAAVGNMTAAGN